MMVAEKYKQTEVGVIPSDWEVKTIGEIFTFYSTSNFSKAEMTLNGEVGCVHYGLIHAISNTIFSLNNGVKYYVTKEQAKYETLQNGDVVMVDASEDLVGINKSVEVSGIGNKEYIAGLHTFHLRDKNATYIDSFRGLVLNSEAIKKQMLRLAVGMKVFGVSKPQLQQVLVPLPTKAEQTAIATALFDADALISSLEKLITKKRNIKQGAMQKLLQPKEGWEVKKLGEVVNITSGESPSKFEFVENGIAYFKVEQLNNGFTYADQTEYFIKYENPIPAGSIIFPKRGASIFLNKIRILRNPSYMDTNLMTITPNDEVSNTFLYYSLINVGLDQVADTTSIPQINNKHILPFELSFPPKEEQIRIATILSDMDAEISALESKLEKYRKVKLGMMQNLLTGKIRLI